MMSDGGQMARINTNASFVSNGRALKKRMCGMKVYVAMMVIVGVILLCIFAVALPAYFVTRDTEATKSRTSYPDGLTDAELLAGDGVFLDLIVDSLTPSSLEGNGEMMLAPTGSYEQISQNGVVYVRDAEYLSAAMGAEHSMVLSTGSSFNTDSLLFTLEPVKPLFDYPFDQYTVEFPVTVTKVTLTTGPENERVPISLLVTDRVAGWTADVSITAEEDYK
eukprot:Cvel_22581.t1-p1 / transcript=Cvel_22581.t1 / gene=Cvel_22581 / organism=Chromera_velia_CCMP2878 / gene_product=hypothetical protein / transcript_product=hypothetical protein / location=Cvel_scaffold2233:593-2471(-) / protein_length=220 / sequence_SO=supercontig / SO=protein_coding / is_pseudo=false